MLWVSLGSSLPVHPHVRGVYMITSPMQSATFGSSPRAWGILVKGDIENDSGRFIPTCVGYTTSYLAKNANNYGSSPRAWGIQCHRVPVRGRSSVHPHVRGVYFCPASDATSAPGSSPRAWGILKRVFFFIILYRFIPTCVGYTVRR